MAWRFGSVSARNGNRSVVLALLQIVVPEAPRSGGKKRLDSWLSNPLWMIVARNTIPQLAPEINVASLKFWEG